MEDTLNSFSIYYNQALHYQDSYSGVNIILLNQFRPTLLLASFQHIHLLLSLLSNYMYKY